VVDIPAGWRGSLIVDGLFGIGLARPLAADYAALVEYANRSAVPILALDVPSGLDADTGIAHGPTIRATATATFIALKPGLLTGDGIDACGDVSIHSLGLEPEAIRPAPGHRLDWSALAPDLPAVLPRRTRNVQGSSRSARHRRSADGMVGAPLWRACGIPGAGKVWIGFAGNSPAVDGASPAMLRHAPGPGGGTTVVCGRGGAATSRRPSGAGDRRAVPLVLGDALK
jgi:hypothetical protein